MSSSIEDFFRAVLSGTGFPCLATIHPGTGVTSHYVCENIRKLVISASGLEKMCRRDGTNLYFCISTLAQRSYLDTNNKMRVRTQDNCLVSKVLVLDVDVVASGEKNGHIAYKTQDEARLGVQHLCDTLKIPDPIVVNSGHGLHVYWPFTEAIESRKWAVLAHKFKSACANVDKRLTADGSRVADSAGLLRVPGSVNVKVDRKSGEAYPIKEVYIEQDCGAVEWSFEDYTIQIEGYNAKHDVPMSITQDMAPAKTGLKPIVGSLEILPTFEPVAYSTLVKNCNFFKHYDDNRNSDDVSYAEWYAIINMLAHHVYVTVTVADTEVHLSPQQAAIYLSRGYPRYSRSETLFKLQESTEAGVIKTRRTCASLSEINPEACRTCRFRTLGIQYPFEAGSKYSAPVERIVVEKPHVAPGGMLDVIQVELPAPPKPYSIGEDGGVYRRMAGDKDSEDAGSVKIYEHRIVPVQRIKDDETGNYCVELEASLPHDGVVRFVISNEDFHDERTLMKELSKKGILVDKKFRPFMLDYLIKYTKLIQNAQAATENFETFGWKYRETDSRKFVLHDVVIRNDGVMPYRNTSRNIKELGAYATSKGELEEAIKVLRIYEGHKDMEPYIITLMLSFGAPLLAFLNELGLIYNLIGPGGEGKSSAAFFASSIWGKPTESHGLKIDTVASLLDKIGIFSNLPFTYDEITALQPDALSELAYSITNGRGKDRLNSDGTRQKNMRHWQTVLLSSSNYSLYGKLAELRSGNNASAYRILEFPAPQANHKLRLIVDDYKAIAKQNYGVLGRRWMQFIFQNYHRIWESVKLAQANVKREHTSSDASKERFWNAAQVIVQVACTYTKELGFHKYNADQLLTYMRNTLPRADVKDVLGDAVSKLNDYINQNANGVIKIMDDKLVNIDLDARGMNAVSMRLEGYNGTVRKGYIPVASIERWCRMSNTDLPWLKSELSRTGVIMRTIRKRVGSGTKFFSLQANCWEIDMLHPKITGVDRSKSETGVIKLMEAV